MWLALKAHIIFLLGSSALAYGSIKFSLENITTHIFQIKLILFQYQGNWQVNLQYEIIDKVD